MPETIIKKLEELVAQGKQLAPMGGFDFSGYNARLQNKYLDWRKACLAALDEVGPIGFSYKNKIQGDQNGNFFFQASAQLILNAMNELTEKVKASPDLMTSAAEAASGGATSGGGGTRVLKPPPKKTDGSTAATQPARTGPAGEGSKRVYVIGEETDPLRQQLSMFLAEIGLEEVSLNRKHGQMLVLDEVQHQEGARCAFFVFNSDDLTYAMFEVGHFVGKLGQNRVFVLHMSDVEFPKNVPGVLAKSIVVKLEEASLSLIRELKAAGYKISL